MSNFQYIAPAEDLEVFTCPHCNGNTGQNWKSIRVYKYQSIDQEISMIIKTANCHVCKKCSVWVNDYKPIMETIHNKLTDQTTTGGTIPVAISSVMCYPLAKVGPVAPDDLPNDLKIDYEEARSVASISPRSAAALLRLITEKICNDMVGESGSLDTKIQKLEKMGLAESTANVLHTLRCFGNEAVHPGEIDLTDGIEIVTALFSLIDNIVTKLITEPRKENELFDLIPDSKKDAIQKNRDKAE
jgi:hypothetical protein